MCVLYCYNFNYLTIRHSNAFNIHISTVNNIFVLSALSGFTLYMLALNPIRRLVTLCS